VNRLRDELGRQWFRAEHSRLAPWD
jgi:hypothetical protein